MTDTNYQEPKIHPTTLKMLSATQVRVGDIYCTWSKGKIQAIGYVVPSPYNSSIKLRIEGDNKVDMCYMDFISGNIVNFSISPNFLVHILRYDQTLPPIK